MWVEGPYKQRSLSPIIDLKRNHNTLAKIESSAFNLSGSVARLQHTVLLKKITSIFWGKGWLKLALDEVETQSQIRLMSRLTRTTMGVAFALGLLTAARAASNDAATSFADSTISMLKLL